MLGFLYSFGLLCWALMFMPVLIYRHLIGKKKVAFFSRLDLLFYQKKTGSPTVWLHAVSLGEMKAAQFLIEELKKQKSLHFVVTTQTHTGYQFAKQVMGLNVWMMPLDLMVFQKKILKKIDPQLVLVMESDLWLNMLQACKQAKIPVYLINGKVSWRTFQRWTKFSFFPKTLLRCLTHAYVQNDEMWRRFSPFISSQRLTSTGNIKLLKPIHLLNKTPIDPKDRWIALACTHEGEEIELFKALAPLIAQGFKLAIAPRHPERFDGVVAMIKKIYPDVRKYSDKVQATVTIVDQMGVLHEVYARSLLVVMGGSFSSRVGGHDIFEPIAQGVFTFFGPAMHGQQELADLAIASGLGARATIEELQELVSRKLFSQESPSVILEQFEKIKQQTLMSYQRVIEQLVQHF